MPDSAESSRTRLPVASDTWTRLASDLVPVGGVALFGWDARATLFILSCEVIVLAASLGWLFDAPRRSTARGVLTAALFLPPGLLLWVVLARLRPEPPYSVAATLADLAPITWPALVGVVVHGLTATRAALRRARARGASIRGNDRILLRLAAAVFGPFLVFTAVAVVGRSLGPAGLAAVLLTKAVADLPRPSAHVPGPERPHRLGGVDQ